MLMESKQSRVMGEGEEEGEEEEDGEDTDGEEEDTDGEEEEDIIMEGMAGLI